ncbi:MAG: PAS domain S-box protein [Archaeoglobaceae archaeon]
MIEFREIVEKIGAVVLLLDRDARVIFANPAIQFLGFSVDYLIGKSIYEFIPQRDLESVRKTFENALQGEKTSRIWVELNKNGEILWIEIVFSTLKKGEEPIVIAEIRDFSEIKEKEEFYRKIVNNSLSGLILLEEEKIVFANKTAGEITGYGEELIGKNVFSLFEEKYHKEVKETIRRILNGERVETITSFLRKGGLKRYAKILASLLEHRGKKNILVSFEDITEKKIAESRLEERELLYRTLVESSHTGIFIIQNNKIVYANEITEKMLGYTIEEINSMEHPYNIVLPEFREMTKERYRAREQGLEVPESYEVKVRTKNGEEKWLKVLARRIKYKGKWAVMVNIADVSKLKESEEMFRKMNKLLRISGEVKDMLLQEKSEFKILLNLKVILEKLNAEVGVYLINEGVIPIQAPKSFSNLSFKNKNNLEKVVQEFQDWGYFTFIPIFSETLHSIVVVARKEKFSDEEIEVFSTISKDVSIRFKALKIEREREMALRMIIENLSQFEDLADKLRNPIAAIEGYLEIKDEIGEGEVIRKIAELVQKIEIILDELRYREVGTYEMKKLLEK